MFFDLPPADPGIELTLASHGMSKGLGQTEGPQVVPRAFVRFGSVLTGVQWKNVESAVINGEGWAYLNWQHKFGGTQVGVGTNFKFQTGISGPTDDKAIEVNGFVSRNWGKARLRVNAIYTPDDLGSTGKSLYVEGGPSYELAKTVQVFANVGRRERSGAPDYTSFNAGISKAAGKLTFEARYYDTAQSDIGQEYHARGVASVRLAL